MNTVIEHIRKNCPNIYDDPHAGWDMCSLFGCHCVAIDSPYSQAERGESICKVFNTLPAMHDTLGKKKCVLCHALFTVSNNRQCYCPQCGKTVQREKARKRKQKSRSKSRVRASEIVDI